MIKNAISALKNLILPKKTAVPPESKTLSQEDTKKSGTSVKPVIEEEKKEPTPTLPSVSYPVRNFKVTTGYAVWGKYWNWHINDQGQWKKGKVEGKGQHKGYDFATPMKTPVFSVHNGKVTFAGKKGSLGIHIRQVIPGIGYAVYAHLNNLYVRKGEFIEKGQEIAETGKTGNTTGPHLHVDFRTKEGQAFPVEFI